MTAVAICLIAAVIAGVSVLHGVRQVAAPRPARSAPVTPRTSARPSPTHRLVIGAPVAELTLAVRRMMSVHEGAAARREYGTAATGRPVVQLMRTSPNRTWAFGTTVIPVPAGSAAPPWTALFLAHASGGRWDIALSGTAGFGRMLGSASAAVLTAAEKQLLARFNAAQVAPAPAGTAPSASTAPPASTAPSASAAPPASTAPPGAASGLGGAAAPGGTAPASAGLALPWRKGQSWRFVAAFGGSGAGQAATMLAFSGGDGRVRAVGPGLLYRFCGGPGSDALIEVIHPDGSATEYYQLRAETLAADGSLVTAGTYLGMTGTALACGGTAPGPGPGPGPGPTKKTGVPLPGTVSFAVIAGGRVADLNGLTLGGWTFHQQATPALMWAQRAGVRLMLGGLLRNFGAAAPSIATSGPTQAPSPAPSPGPSPSSSPGQSVASQSPVALGRVPLLSSALVRP